ERRSHRPPGRAQDRQARTGRPRPPAGLREVDRDTHLPRDQLVAGPARPPRRARAGRRRGRRQALRRLGRPLGRRARLRRARHRPGAASVDDGRPSREHAQLERDPEAEEAALTQPEAEVRAVVFDLWETLALWPAARTSELFHELAERLGGVDWADTYVERMTTPLETYYRSLGADTALAAELAAARTAFTREILAPREGAVETLDELRRRGFRLGLISVCSEDVCLVWDETDFAGRFDAAVFSAACGLMKPDPRI